METKALKSKLKKLPKNEQEAILEFKDRLVQALGDNLVMLKLYGSKARGDWHEDSDIDLLVVAHGQRLDLESRVYKIWFELESKYNFKPYISPNIFSWQDYLKNSNPPTSFFYTLNQDAKNIWQNPKAFSQT